jgi:hypothetical protein
MKHATLISLVVSACIAAGAAAAEQGHQERLEAIRAELDAGKYVEAAAAARQFIGGVRDDQAKTEAMRILAAALRKQGEWRLAAKAYADLRDRCAKGSESNVRYGAAAEVLQASPKGVYPPLEPKPAADATPRTLAEDSVLDAALVRVGEARAEKLKAVVAAMKKAASAKDVAAKFAETIDGLAKARFLAPALPVDQDREAAEAAGAALDAVQKESLGKLRAQVTELEQTITARHTVSTAQRKQLGECQETLMQMSDAEESFRQTLGKVPRDGWGGEVLKLGIASGQRTAECGKLTGTCRLLQAVGSWR